MTDCTSSEKACKGTVVKRAFAVTLKIKSRSKLCLLQTL